MKNKKLGRLIVMFVTALGWLGLIGAVTSVRSQDLICCDTFIDADGNWFGARRDCKAALQELSAASRAKACQQIKKIKPPPKNAPWFKPFTDSASQAGCCPEAADACGDPSMNCTAAPPPENRPKLPTPPDSKEEAPCKAGDAKVTPTISIELAETLNVDKTPEMPELTATARVSPPSTDVTWTARITFSAPGGRSCSGGPTFDSPEVSGQGETFTPDFGALYGGKLEIKAKTTCGKGAETTITRDVGGLNADPSEVRIEIGTMTSPFEADDLKKIACHESRQRQFTGSNRPTMGPSADAGIMQICYQRTVGDIWNWKTNIARGRANLLASAAYSRNVPLYIRRGYYMAGGKRKDWLPGGTGPFPNAMDFTPEQLRLEAIKRYNAGYLPNVGYWEWDDAASAWVANPQGGGDPNYVANVIGQNASCP